MATACEVKVRCNNCLTEFQSEIYTWIDRAVDREIVQTIFEGTFNEKQCPKCENQGLVRFPVEVIDSANGHKAIFVFLLDNNVPVRLEPLQDSSGYTEVEVLMKGFSVAEILREQKTEPVVYSTNDLIETLISWGEEADVFPDQLTEEEIQEGLRSNLISEREAEIVRQADFAGAVQRLLRENLDELPADIGEAVEIALKIKRGLKE
jgi:hypothetical protein